MLSSKRKAARAAAAGLAGASLLALGLATAAVAAPPGKDAPTFVAYASDGSVDFSSWNPTTDAVLAEASFDRNGRTFDVTIQKPTPQSAGDFLVYPPLASNLIDWDPQVGPGPHFYSNFSSRQMSYFAIGFDAAAQRIVGATPTFYEKAVPGGRAAAQVFTVPGTDGLVTVSDITWVDGQRQLRHLYTVTNKSDEALPGVNFEARIDLALDDNDRVGLAKATGTSVFMENNEVAMYLLLTAGDYLAAGAYSAATSSMTLVTDWQFSHGSELVAPGSLDTALAYALEDRTIQPNSSVSLTALERFYAAGELDEPQAKVVFWDDDADTELAVEGSPVLLTGDPFTPISYTNQDAADALPAGYVVDRIEGADDAYFDDLNDTTPTVTVHARHAHVYADGSASRTIVYQGAGDATPEPVVCQYGWTSDTDLAAGSTAYTIESGCPAVATPVLAGFTADTAEVPALLTGRVSARPEDTTVTVTYTATPAHARVVFWDDEAGVALAVSPIQLNGLVGAPLVFSNEDAAAALPAGYTLDRVEGRGTYDDDDETIQTVTVHARHGHVAGDLVTTRTITYTGAGGLTPAPSICQINWVYDTDQVLGQTVYSSDVGCPAVATPVLAGFTADTAEVPALAPTPSTRTAPTDQAVTVTYSVRLGQAQVVFWDDDAETELTVKGGPITLSGQVGSPLVFSNEDAAAALPAGYTLDRVEGRGTYDDDDETIQTVTVHARHGHVAGDLVTTRTITYTGAGGLTPAPSICQINWVYDTNSVTGKTVYTPSGTCPAVVTPTLAGFTADTAVVPAWAPGTTEKRPADTAVTVKYAAETAALPVTGSRDAWSVSLIALGALLVGLALTVVARRMPTRSR